MLKSRNNSPFLEAYVLSVDIKRGACKCRSIDGHYLTNVPWMRGIGSTRETGDNNVPIPGEVVYLTLINSQYVIFCSKSTLSYGDTVRSQIGEGRFDDSFEEAMNLSAMKGINRAGGSVPEDQVPGDKVFTNDSGGVLGLLRSGSFLAKVSPLAQIFLSRFDDLLRLVSRNYEQFSDVVQRVQVNTKGKLYQYTGYYRSSKSSLEDTPDYYEVIGEVAAGELAKGDYLTVDVSSASSDLVKKQVVPLHWEKTLDILGKEITRSYDGGKVCLEEMSPGEYKLTVSEGGDKSSIKITAKDITLDTTGKVILTCKGLTSNVTGDITETITGNVTRTIIGNNTTTVVGTSQETSTGPWTIAGNPTILP